MAADEYAHDSTVNLDTRSNSVIVISLVINDWRTANRAPRRSVAGRWADRLITAVLRRGGRAESSSAATVLWRAARTAGTNVATIATASATATTKAAVVPVSDGALGAPR